MVTPRAPEEASITVSRAEALTEGIKTLLLANGGGAVALLAFLQEIWINTPALARPILRGLGGMTAGLVLALLVPVFRYFHSHASRRISVDDRRTLYWYCMFACYLASILFFAGSVAFLILSASASPVPHAPTM
jgi:hypothetical protein